MDSRRYVLTQLPEELIGYILIWMNVIQLCRLAATCRRMYRLIMQSGIAWTQVDFSSNSLKDDLRLLEKNNHCIFTDTIMSDTSVRHNSYDDCVVGSTCTTTTVKKHQLCEERLILFFNGILGQAPLASIRSIHLEGPYITDNLIAVILARCPRLEHLSLRCDTEKLHIADILNNYWHQGLLLPLRILDLGSDDNKKSSSFWNHWGQRFSRRHSEACLKAMQGIAYERQKGTVNKTSYTATLDMTNLPTTKAMSIPILSGVMTVGHVVQQQSQQSIVRFDPNQPSIQVWPMPCDGCGDRIAERRQYRCGTCSSPAYLCSSCRLSWTCFSNCGRYQCRSCPPLTGTPVVCLHNGHVLGRLCTVCDSRRVCGCTLLRARCRLHHDITEQLVFDEVHCCDCGRWSCAMCARFSVCSCRPGIALCHECRIDTCMRCGATPEQIPVSSLCAHCHRHICERCDTSVPVSRLEHTTEHVMSSRTISIVQNTNPDHIYVSSDTIRSAVTTNMVLDQTTGSS
jgi:hypothetical protein